LDPVLSGNRWVFEVFEYTSGSVLLFFFGKHRADGSLILQYKQEPAVIIKLKYVPNTGQLDGWEKALSFWVQVP